MTIGEVAERLDRYENVVADQAREIADLRERIGRHIGEAAITIADLKERHDTWVRKSAFMLEVGKNERTDLRDKIKTATNDHDALGETVGALEHRIGVREENAEALDNSVAAYRDEQDTLRERVEQREIDAQWARDEIKNLLKNTPSLHVHAILEKRMDAEENQTRLAMECRHILARRATEAEKRMDAMDKRQQSHEDWHIEEIVTLPPEPEHPHKRHNSVAEMCEDMGIDYEPEQPTDETAVMGSAFLPPDQPDPDGSSGVKGETVPCVKSRAEVIRGLVDEYYKKWFYFGTGTWATLTKVYRDELRRDSRFPHIFDDGKTTGATCMIGDYVDTPHGACKFSYVTVKTYGFVRWLAHGEVTS